MRVFLFLKIGAVAVCHWTAREASGPAYQEASARTLLRVTTFSLCDEGRRESRCLTSRWLALTVPSCCSARRFVPGIDHAQLSDGSAHASC